MNKKGKNKKGHKPVSVQPETGTGESKVVSEEKVESVIPEVSETVTEPAEAKEDVPKKPKRSKGKKNKDNNEINTEEEAPKVLQELVEIKPDDVVENVTDDKPETLPVIPSARKKKNKKKGNQSSDIINQPCDASQENVGAEATIVEQPELDTIDDDVAEFEFKPSKKKNKKKKRNDSEKSDKEEVVSSTTAFQNLAISVETSLVEDKSEDKPLLEQQPPSGIEDIEVRTDDTPALLPTPLEPVEVIPAEDKSTKDEFKTEHKSKKKNKKDKKQPSNKPEESRIVEIPTEELSTENQAGDITATKEITYPEKSSSSTPKTNVMIPVAPLKDEIATDTLPKDTAQVASTKEETIPVSPALEKSDLIEGIIEKPDRRPIPTIPSESIDTLVPSDKKRKKGRKSPKPSDTEIKADKQIPHSDCNIEMPSVSTQASVTEADQFKTDKIGSVTEESIEQSISSNKNVEVISEIEIVTQPKLEAKSLKKRKKSPRPVVKCEERAKTTQPIVEQSSNKQEEAASSKEKPEVPPAQRLDELEIRSLTADESEGSACEFTPEILHPRATSQQLIDDNNNMVIREIFTTEQNISTPVSPSTIETPTTPQTSRKFKVSEQKEKDGKTDLKSKMMEVNKDMEGLRLSIEKSLAGFTALEKSEEKIEKQYENTMKKKKETAKTDKEDKKEIASENKDSASQNIENASLIQFVDETMRNLPETSGSVVECTPKEQNLPSTTPSDITTSEILSEKIPLVGPTNVDTNAPTPQTLLDLLSSKVISEKQAEIEAAKSPTDDEVPICPSRKDHKGKHKKKKGKQESNPTAPTNPSTSTATTSTAQSNVKEDKKEEKGKTQSYTKGKQQSSDAPNDELSDYEPIENFEDALTSSVDDVNKTFEIMMNEENEQTNPKINITAPDEDTKPIVKPSKNLLGHPDIPVRSSKRDYKKEKDKRPNDVQATVKINDDDQIEKKSKNTQTVKKMIKDCAPKVDNDEFVYKYNFRKVFLQCACHVCKKDLSKNRVPCGYCHLLFYCNAKHKDEDWPQHQALCFAVSTLVHLKDQKHIYADTKGLSGHEYRLARMQMIVSCEKVLKRRLVPWEQEALLYPRMCANVDCREWRQGKLQDCDVCGQISYCSEKPEHLPKSHQRWCKSYSLYQKLVCYQQTKGRLEPKLPTKIMADQFLMPEKMNEVLASIYEEKIDMNDIQYAALTQIATAPLTAACAHQIYASKTGKTTNGHTKKSSFTLHVVGAELQFEADALNKWEVFFLHLRPDLLDLRVVLINYNLNPSNLPLDLLGKVKLCENCRLKKRRVSFGFQDKMTYAEYKSSEDFIHPDLICAFNPSIQRSSIYNGQDPWPATIQIITKLRAPFLLTSYTMPELQKDYSRIKELSENPITIISEAKFNSFASVRPDRNFISDDEMPLLFKNYCYIVMCGN